MKNNSTPMDYLKDALGISSPEDKLRRNPEHYIGSGEAMRDSLAANDPEFAKILRKKK